MEAYRRTTPVLPQHDSSNNDNGRNNAVNNRNNHKHGQISNAKGESGAEKNYSHRKRRKRRPRYNANVNVKYSVMWWICVFSILFSIGLIFTVSSRAGSKSENVDTTVAGSPHSNPSSLSSSSSSSSSLFKKYTSNSNLGSCSVPLSSSSISYTLVTQLSEDRMWMLPHHCSRWGPHPISIAVLSDLPPSVLLKKISPFCDPSHVTILTLPTTDIPDGDYPVNRLRNMALSSVRTSHVLYADVDFWESSNLHSVLTSPAILTALSQDPKLALVVPAFQIARQCQEYRDCRPENISQMPTTRDQLLHLLNDHQANAFDPTNRGGHGSTDYPSWMHQSAEQILPLDCFTSNRYEPYLVMRYCDTLPPFQETFTGYGKNKMTFVMQLRKYGYIFYQLGTAFLVHYPHLDSKARLVWNEAHEEMYQKKKKNHDTDKNDLIKLKSYKRTEVDQIFVKFKRWLDQLEIIYGDEGGERVHLCDDAQDDDHSLWVKKD